MRDIVIPLFHPYVPQSAIDAVDEVLRTRWIGQGPKVDQFEEMFSKWLRLKSTVAMGSGTDALHLSYVLSGLKRGDEVISPVFTCTATNTPFLQMGVKVKFADIDPKTLTIDIEHAEHLVTARTKALVVVHYGGCPCDMEKIRAFALKHNVPVIHDAAQALGAKWDGVNIGLFPDYVAYSFQAIKHITTGDGGMLCVPHYQVEEAKRRRWFGIDRKAKLGGVWQNDIWEVGFKYQMTDIAAAMGIEGLKQVDKVLEHRRLLFGVYSQLGDIAIGLDDNHRESAAWLFTIAVDDRVGLERKLKERGIESGQVHYRNDRYTVFKEFKTDCPNMDLMEERYLVLPLHMYVTTEDAEKICGVIKEGW
jgi:dTDP-4-amino-4,6-dideoxygalactose transaminase